MKGDLLPRREKVKNERIFLVFLKVNVKGGAAQGEIFGTILLPLLRWPISDPRAKPAFRPRHFCTTFAMVQRNSVDNHFQNPAFSLNPGAPHNNTKMRMGAAQEINFGHFWRPWFWALCGHFRIGNMKTPCSPQFWAFLHSATRCQLQTQSNPEGGAKDERPKIICCRVPHFKRGAPRRCWIFRAPLAITGALLL